MASRSTKVPNTWRRDGDELVRDIETDDCEAALAFATKLWRAGVVHPNMLSLTPNPAEWVGAFNAGRVAVTNGSIGGYSGLTGQTAKLQERNADATTDVLTPPGADGGVGMISPDLGFYCMLSIPWSVKDEARVHEILGVINYLAAPMGSQEYFLVHYSRRGAQLHDEQRPAEAVQRNEAGRGGNPVDAGLVQQRLLLSRRAGRARHHVPGGGGNGARLRR